MNLILLAAGSCLAAGAVFLGYPLGIQIVDRINRRHVADLRQRMGELGMESGRLEFFLRLWWLSIGGSFLILWLAAGALPVALVAAFLLFRLCRPLLNRLAESQRVLVRDQMVLASRALASQVRAGLSLVQGLAEAGRQVSAPVGPALLRALSLYNQGSPLSQVLRGFKDTLRTDATTLFVLAAQTCHERGGNLARSLDSISRSLEELQRVERQREANTASGRLVVLVLAIFPAAFLALFYFLDPDSTRSAFSTLVGQLTLCVVALLVFVSVRWANYILTVQD